MHFRKIIFFFFFFSTCYLHGQEGKIRFEHLTKASGLSQSTVYSIIQDKLGFIWIGTSDGLNRFDGYSIKKYYYNSDNPNSISNNRIYNMLVDSDGVLWIATLGGGLNRYQVETDDFIAYRYQKDNQNCISQDIVMSLYEDKDGIIWIGTADGGLNRFDKKQNTFKRYLYNPNNKSGIAFNTVSSIAADKNGNLWLGSNQLGLDKFDLKTETFTHYQYNPNNPNSISSNNVNHVFVDSRNYIYISTDNGLNILNPENSNITKLFSSPSNSQTLRTNDVHYVLEDNDNNIWVGTYGGLSLLEKEKFSTFKFINYFNNPIDFSSLSNNLTRCIYQDNSGLIWVGNFSNGVDYFNPHPPKFTSYQNDPNKNSISNNLVRSFKEDITGNIWIGTFGGGLNRFDPKTKQFEIFRNNPKDNNTISKDYVNAICIDSNDGIWIGTYGGGLDFFDKKTRKFKHYQYKTDESNSLSNNYIRTMIFDSYGFLWIATSGGGLNMFDPKTEKFTHYNHEDGNPYSINDNRVMGLCEDHNGNIWVGSSSEGLNMFVRSKNAFEHFSNDPHDTNTISSNRIFCIYESTDQKTIWVGTGNGLNKFNPDNSTFTHFSKENGFPSDVIFGILEDNNGVLWLSTNDGLCKFDFRFGKGEILKVYDDRDGLSSREFSEGAYFKDKQGQFYFGSVKGFTVFDPLKIVDSPLKPSTYIVDFKLFNKTVPISSKSKLKQNIVLTNRIDLKYSDYVFSFEFAGLNYFHSDKNQYLYKMDQFDDDWILTDAKRRFVTYTNLDPGTYTFMVKASNNDGVWNDKSTNITIFIQPPYWKTWWFRVLFIIIVIIGIIGYLRWRTSSLIKQKIQLEKIVKEKTAKVVHQQEELEAYNKELELANKELSAQSEELESTLNTLQTTQKQLIQSEKLAMLGILSSGIAHEINNPLNFIQGGALGIQSYLEEDLPNKIEKYQPLIEAIYTGVDRASAIVSSLNNYSRHDDSPRSEVDIHKILDDCLLILSDKLENRIEVIKNYTGKQCIVFGSEGQLHKIFLNIITNAEQAIENNGTINITTDVSERNVVVSIKDSGCGISADTVNKVFDPFFTTKAPGQGTGLGLSLTLNFIQEHNGTIKIESKEGHGTEVLVRFPANQVFK